MSEVVHYRGKLYEVEKLENETLEEQCKRLLENKELDEFYDSYKEMLLDDLSDYFTEHNEVIYRITKENVDIDEDIFQMNKNEDGSISFEVKYYNGGCGFSEAIEEAFENIK